MTVQPYIAAVSLDDIFPIIIVITVLIARMVKAVKDNAPRSQPPPTPPNRERDDEGWRPVQSGTNPGAELREFLSALSGEPTGEVPRPTPPRPAPPPPPPTPTATPTATPTLTRQRAQAFSQPPHQPRQPRQPVRTRRVAPESTPDAPATVVPPMRRRRDVKSAPRAPKPMTVTARKKSPFRSTLKDHLDDRRSLRGAWLLREVLGPPVALKHEMH